MLICCYTGRLHCVVSFIISTLNDCYASDNSDWPETYFLLGPSVRHDESTSERYFSSPLSCEVVNDDNDSMGPSRELIGPWRNVVAICRAARNSCQRSVQSILQITALDSFFSLFPRHLFYPASSGPTSSNQQDDEIRLAVTREA